MLMLVVLIEKHTSLDLYRGANLYREGLLVVREEV